METYVREAIEQAHEGAPLLAILKTGATATNARHAEYDHYLCLVEQSDHVRLLSYPWHPRAQKRLDISWVSLPLAKHVVTLGHDHEPMRYRFLDHLRSAQVVEDRHGFAAPLVEAAKRRVHTRRLQGDYVHSVSAYVEDMWGELARGNPRAAWVVAREVAAGACAMLLEEENASIPARDRFAAEAKALGPDVASRYARLAATPDDAPRLVARLLDAVRERGDAEYAEEPRPGPVEQRLLGEVKRIADDLASKYGDDLRAVGATGSIGRNSATEGADYDVHVLVRPRHPDDRMRIDFRLYVPTYPGLPRRAELGFTPTSFLDELLRIGVQAPFSYYHLDHVRHTALVHDPFGDGARYRAAVWKVRPPPGFVENALDRIAEVLANVETMPPEVRGNVCEYLADECARLMLMRYGLGFVKPKYRSLNLDKVRAQEPWFFKAYDRVKGLDALTPEAARGGVVAATELFDLVLERMGVDFRYRCEEMTRA